MAYESEIAFFIDDRDFYVDKILWLGFEKKFEKEQLDMMFDTPDADLWLKQDSKIRLRVEDGKVELTFKWKPFVTSGFAKRVELNIPLSVQDIDKYKLFFESIWYPLLFQLKKERISYRKWNVAIEFDNYPILWWRIEIEWPENEIQELWENLFPWEKYEFKYLSDFFLDHMSKTGKSIEELKSEYFVNSGFDVGNIEKILYYG